MAWIASFFLLKESPRWLAAQDRHEEAMAALKHIRGSSTGPSEVQAEIEEIQLQLEIRRQTLAGVKFTTVVKEIATIPSYRRRFVLAVAMQTVAQWSGGNGITYYIPQVRSVPLFPLPQKPANPTSPDFRARRRHRRQHLPHNLRRLRYREARLHHGLRLGSRRLPRPALLLPDGSNHATRLPHLSLSLHPHPPTHG